MPKERPCKCHCHKGYYMGNFCSQCPCPERDLPTPPEQPKCKDACLCMPPCQPDKPSAEKRSYKYLKKMNKFRKKLGMSELSKEYSPEYLSGATAEILHTCTPPEQPSGELESANQYKCNPKEGWDCNNCGNLGLANWMEKCDCKVCHPKEPSSEDWEREWGTRFVLKEFGIKCIKGDHQCDNYDWECVHKFVRNLLSKEIEKERERALVILQSCQCCYDCGCKNRKQEIS